MLMSSTSASCWTAVRSTTRAPARTASSASRISSLSNGLLMNALAPASPRARCDEVCMSADTTTTLAVGSSSRSFSSTSSPYMPRITRSSRTTSGFSRKYRSSALSPSSASTTSQPADSRICRRLRRASAESSTMSTSRLHMRSMIAAANRSSGTASSLSPASTTDRGIPYTTHVSSASVSTAPPRALIHAAPSRPSVAHPRHHHAEHAIAVDLGG